MGAYITGAANDEYICHQSAPSSKNLALRKRDKTGPVLNCSVSGCPPCQNSPQNAKPSFLWNLS